MSVEVVPDLVTVADYRQVTGDDATDDATVLARLTEAAALVEEYLGRGLAAKERTERLPLSPQECVTECQARQTDCIQDCEGRIPCEKECVTVGEGCVARCRHPSGDAGVRPHPCFR